jgi:hypothetical protein
MNVLLEAWTWNAIQACASIHNACTPAFVIIPLIVLYFRYILVAQRLYR